MSDEMVGQRENFFKGHEAGMKEGYLKALEDVHKEINAIPASYNTISIPLVNGLISKLKGKQ